MPDENSGNRAGHRRRRPGSAPPSPPPSRPRAARRSCSTCSRRPTASPSSEVDLVAAARRRGGGARASSRSTAASTRSSPRRAPTRAATSSTSTPTPGSASSPSTCSAPPRSCAPRCPRWRRSRGRVVTVASTLGLRALPAATAYCASKFGVVGFTRALASELGDRVGVTLLVPGGMRTHFFDDRPEDFKPAADQHLNDPADVARTVVFALRQPAGLRAARAAGGAGHRAVLAVSRPRPARLPRARARRLR